MASALIGMGAAGINIEDGTRPGTRELAPPEVLCERIAAIRKLDARFFINARTDVYFVPWDDPVARFEEALRRAQLYAAAGAGGIFVPGMSRSRRDRTAGGRAEPARERVRGLCRRAARRWAGARRCRRISLGCGPLQSALGLVDRIAKEAFEHGRSARWARACCRSGEINGLFAATA